MLGFKVMPRKTPPSRPPAKGLKIRAATLDDAEAVARLSHALGYPATVAETRERLRGLLGREDQRIVVAVDRGRTLCGWLQAHSSTSLETGFRVEIVGLIVSEAMRRKGIGGSLVAHAETWAKEIGAETVVVRSNAKRVESNAFYPALGYLPRKTQVVYVKRASI